MTDRRTVLTVVTYLGLFALGALAGVIWLLSVHIAGDAIAPVVGLCGTALGALGALLVSTRTIADPSIDQLAQTAHAQGAAETEAAIAKLA